VRRGRLSAPADSARAPGGPQITEAVDSLAQAGGWDGLRPENARVTLLLPSRDHVRCSAGAAQTACVIPGSAGVRSRSGLHLPLCFRPGFWFGGVAMGMKPGATPEAREAGWRACVALADARAAALAPVISEIRSSGMTSPVRIAAALSARGIPTARGHRVWENGPVRQLLNRVDRLAAAGALGPEIAAIAPETER
jgi:hypothetical protein